jgi:methylated-DNA-[protein]-cysteine S-methyltransferase
MERIRWSKVEVDDYAWFVAITERGLKYVGIVLPETIRAKGEYVESLGDVGLQVEGYLRGDVRTFEVELDEGGTEFQKDVWAAVRAIPYGETRHYAEIAEQIGRPKAVRAVGAAIGRNPILIVTPCHRVIGRNGRLVGYRDGVAWKAKLLAHENHLFTIG